MNVDTKAEVTVRGVVTRNDGTQHDLGVISAYYPNPIKRVIWKLFHKPLADRRIRKFNESQGK